MGRIVCWVMSLFAAAVAICCLDSATDGRMIGIRIAMTLTRRSRRIGALKANARVSTDALSPDTFDL